MECNYPIIILEDDVFYGKMLKNFLLNQNFQDIKLFHDEDACLQDVNDQQVLYLLDYSLTKTTGLQVMQDIMIKNPSASFVCISGLEYSHIALKLIRAGALDYIEKNRHAFYHLKNTLDKIKNNIPLVRHTIFNTNPSGMNLN
jgi:FixJ family two-component response regulator